MSSILKSVAYGVGTGLTCISTYIAKDLIVNSLAQPFENATITSVAEKISSYAPAVFLTIAFLNAYNKSSKETLTTSTAFITGLSLVTFFYGYKHPLALTAGVITTLAIKKVYSTFNAFTSKGTLILENTQLKSKIKSLNSELEGMKNCFENLEEEGNEQGTYVSKKLKRINELQETISLLNSQNETLSEENRKLKQEVTKLTNNNLSLAKTNQDLFQLANSNNPQPAKKK